MPDRWIDDHMGDEGSPRREFTDDLGRELRAEWKGRPMADPAATGLARRRWMALLGAAAVVAVVVAGVIAFGGNDGTQTVSPGADTSQPSTATTTSPSVTASTEPTSTAAVEPSTTTELPTSSQAPPNTAVIIPQAPEAPIAVPANAQQKAVFDYLTALHQGHFDVAATYLHGAIEDSDRVDLRPLVWANPTNPGVWASDAGLTASLGWWCSHSAVCIQPSGLSSPSDGWVAADFVAGGRKLLQHFQVTQYEGHWVVHGLPMRVDLAKVNDMVPCMTERPTLSIPADLNGDGWYEQIEVDSAGVVQVCGTTMVVPSACLSAKCPSGNPFVTSVYPVDINKDGVDRLIIGFEHGDGFQGALYGIGATGTLDSLADVYTSGLTATTLGCQVFDKPGRALAEVHWTFQGGTTQETATGVEFTATPVWPAGLHGEAHPAVLSPTSPEAVLIMNGECNGLPIFTH